VPGDIVGRAVRGNVYLEMGDYPRAMADHDIVLIQAPHDPGALTNACWIRGIANVELDRALTYCDEAVAHGPSRRFAALDTRGFVHFRRGEFGLAIDDYEAALKLHRRLASSLYGRGLARLRLGQEADGQADLAAAAKIEPGIAARYAGWGAAP
jgi:tetratricopeptide (TPR) repeat protein